VQQVFTLPIRHLTNPANSGYTIYKRNKSTFSTLKFPSYFGGPRRVWGLTAFMLDITLMHLVPNRLYRPILSSVWNLHPSSLYFL